MVKLAQLKGQRSRLESELAVRCSEQPCQLRLINRLRRDLAQTVREIENLEVEASADQASAEVSSSPDRKVHRSSESADPLPSISASAASEIRYARG